MSEDTIVDSELEEVTNSTDESSATDAEVDTSSSEAAEKEAQSKRTLEGQVKAAKLKLEAKSVKFDDQPKYIQDALIEQGYNPEGEAKAPELDEEALLVKLEARQRAKQLQAEVNKLELSDEQRSAFETEKQELLEAGLPEDKAIEKARILAAIDEASIEAEARGLKKAHMSLTPQGDIAPPKELDINNDDEFLKWSNKAAETAARTIPSRITR